MDNKEIYKKAVDQIHASDNLKEKTFENITKQVPSKFNYMKYLTVAAVFALVFAGGLYNYNNIENKNKIYAENPVSPSQTEKIEQTQILAMAELPRFESMEELVEILKENAVTYSYYDDMTKGELGVNGSMAQDSAVASPESFKQVEQSASISDLQNTRSDFSTTNVQVENVDEADIVKTDGEYIYYVTNGTVYIVKADGLNVVFKLEVKNEEERFNVNEIFLKGNKIVLLGNSFLKGDPLVVSSTNKELAVDRVVYNNTSAVKAMIYDITDKTNPVKTREIALEGYYIDSRLIGDNLYLISNKSAYYYNNMNENTILPIIKDSVVNVEKRIAYSDVIHFEGTEDMSFTMVGGLNINTDEEINVETFFGAGRTIYANEKNMYLTQAEYKNNQSFTTIYKMNLIDSKLGMQAKTTVKGYLNNQFSMDEYDGNLRVATTANIILEPQKEEKINETTSITSLAKTTTTNNLYIFDKDLKEIGKIEDLAKDEKIYSVRFIGKVGYIVTFKQIDPLFVIDLSDPTNPTVKGKLKIPGYSSYLHPYDENHIIGIGYNTKDNGHGGVTTSTMKMSMFDVSDLENPKELFNVSIGDRYSSSEIIYNHKALFTKFSENLIGFPMTDNKNQGFVIYKIDLENQKFAEYMRIKEDYDYRNRTNRLIYIEDTLYDLATQRIKAYDLNTKESLYELELKNEDENNYNKELIEY